MSTQRLHAPQWAAAQGADSSDAGEYLFESSPPSRTVSVGGPSIGNAAHSATEQPRGTERPSTPDQSQKTDRKAVRPPSDSTGVSPSLKMARINFQGHREGPTVHGAGGEPVAPEGQLHSEVAPQGQLPQTPTTSPHAAQDAVAVEEFHSIPTGSKDKSDGLPPNDLDVLQNPEL